MAATEIQKYLELVEEHDLRGEFKKIIYMLQPHTLAALKDARLYFETGRAHFLNGQYHLAIARSEAASLIDNGFIDPLYLKLMAQRKLGANIQKDPGKDRGFLLKKTLRLIEQSDAENAQLLITEGQPKDIFEFLKNCYLPNGTRDALRYRALYLTISASQAHEDKQYLQGLLDEMKLLNPDSVEPHLQMLDFYRRSKDVNGQIAEMKRVLEFEKYPQHLRPNFEYLIDLHSGALSRRLREKHLGKTVLHLLSDLLDGLESVQYELLLTKGINYKCTMDPDFAYTFLSEHRPAVFVTHIHLNHAKYTNEYERVREITHWVRTNLPDTLIIIETSDSYGKLDGYHFHFHSIFDYFNYIQRHLELY